MRVVHKLNQMIDDNVRILNDSFLSCAHEHNLHKTYLQVINTWQKLHYDHRLHPQHNNE